MKIKSENKKRKVFEDTDTRLPNEKKRNNVSLMDEIQQVDMSMDDKGRNASILNEPAQEIPENSNSDLMIEIPEVNSTVTELPQKKKKILITGDQYAQGFQRVLSSITDCLSYRIDEWICPADHYAENSSETRASERLEGSLVALNSYDSCIKIDFIHGFPRFPN
ncbi:hypothetical protein JTB14_019960 [Gonioctena quinquepunctata]|nr:hypothetical protein JTB14_019960 [Gonioctena quinquepunctata]